MYRLADSPPVSNKIDCFLGPGDTGVQDVPLQHHPERKQPGDDDNLTF